MSDFWRAWLHNVWVTLAAIAAVCVLFFVFMKIFYADALSLTLVVLQGTALFFTGLKLWPIVILAVLVSLLSSTMPPRKRQYRG